MRSADTDPAAERVQLDLLRNATVARRASLARSSSCTALQLTRRAIREVNPAAERQWSDVIGVLKVQAKQLDRDYLAHWAAELEMDDLLERALADAKDV